MENYTVLALGGASGTKCAGEKQKAMAFQVGHAPLHRGTRLSHTVAHHSSHSHFLSS